MSTLRFTAGVGEGSSGACGLPLGWRARKLLPCAPRSPADLAPGHERRARCSWPRARMADYLSARERWFVLKDRDATQTRGVMSK